MSLPQKDILDQIYQLNKDTVLKFHTITNTKDRQTFIVAPVPHSYKTFKVCIFDGLNVSYKVYENCNVIFTEANQAFHDQIKKTYGKSLNFDCYFVKIVESQGTDYSTAIVPTNIPIDLTSIKLLNGQDFDEIVKNEVEKRKKQRMEKQENTEAIKKYTEIEQSMRALIISDITIDSKRVNYRDPAFGSKTSYESFYSYDTETTTEKLGLTELIRIFNSCIKYYGFIESDDTLKNSTLYQDSLKKMLKDKKYKDIDEAISLNKRIANNLGKRYIVFLKYLLSKNINPLEDDFNYIRTWKKYGFGDDKDYTLTVTEPVMKVGAGIRDYITKALSPQESIKFETEIEDLLKNVKNRKAQKR